MRNPPHPSVEHFNLSTVLYALSDPVRLSIIQKLSTDGEQTCGVLSAQIAKSTASHHFRVLREAGIIQMRAEGTQFLNSLRIEDLNKKYPGLIQAVISSANMP